MVRDHKYRGASAEKTLAQWQSVRQGEEKWIFPFQENADAVFNTALLFELAVLRPQAEPLLNSVSHDSPYYGEARRLIRFLRHVAPMSEEQIPPTSLLREFLGGSSFEY
jgi:uridine kinase